MYEVYICMYKVFMNVFLTLLCYYFSVGRALLPKEPDSHNILFKAIQHVIQNEIVVSLSPGVQGICPRDKRLLSCFLEIIYLQHTEVCGLNVQFFCVMDYSCVYLLPCLITVTLHPPKPGHYCMDYFLLRSLYYKH